MQALAEQYAQRLEDIKAAIQEGEALATYLESEEADDYNALKETHEPEIAELYAEVAGADPLQLQALEEAILDPAFEGLFMPKVLGYATLRPRVSEQGRYYRPQDHLRTVLLAIAGSSAFGELEKRIGQGVTVALALSTHVWVTKLIAEIPTKQARNFYQNHHDTQLRTPELRFAAYNRYKRQFAKENYASAAFPTDAAELATGYDDLEGFLRYRFGGAFDNASLSEPVAAMLSNEAFAKTPQFERFIALVGLFMQVPDKLENGLRKQLRELAAEEGFAERYFAQLRSLHADANVEITPEVDQRMAQRVGTSGDGELQRYYALVSKIHEAGIDDLEAQDAIRVYMSEQSGLSDVNECVRQTVLRYFTARMNELDEDNYTEFFSLTKLFGTYTDIFGNESFKQELRTQSVKYVKSLMRRYTDKRGRDYQDIKKFVRTTFVDLKFMNEKEVVNFFKTKRKRKPTAAA